MKKLNGHQKFLSFYFILQEYSGEEHILTTEEINRHLKERCGKEVDRRTIARYGEALNEMGIEVSVFDENRVGYYLRERRFETWELKKMIDDIVRCYSISKKITLKLVDKIAGLDNWYNGYSLKKGLNIDHTPKTVNEQVPYTINNLQRAIDEEKKVRFRYYDYDENYQLVPRRKNNVIREYIGSPYRMLSKKKCQYVVLNIDRYDNVSNFRVDRMQQVEVLEEDARPLTELWGYSRGLNTEEYVGKCFFMYVGKEIRVTMEIHNSLLNFIFEELGEQVTIIEKDEQSACYLITFIAKEGEGLKRWILQMGSKAKVVEPGSLADQVDEEIMAMAKRIEKWDPVRV